MNLGDPLGLEWTFYGWMIALFDLMFAISLYKWAVEKRSVPGKRVGLFFAIGGLGWGAAMFVLFVLKLISSSQ